MEIVTPRDRDGSFEPQRVKKREIRLAGKRFMNTPHWIIKIKQYISICISDLNVKNIRKFAVRSNKEVV